MPSDRDTQVDFFNWIKENKSGIQLAEQLAEILNISKDSAYRRLRGDTLLSFNELSKVSSHFDVSLDNYLKLTSSSVVFQSRTINRDLTFYDYLRSINENMTMIRKFKEHRLAYLAKDIPVFHYYQFPTLTRFKLFFWQRTILNEKDFQVPEYKPDLIGDNLIEVAKSIWTQYEKISSTEIWSEETINITLRQLNYYFESGVISAKNAQEILGDLHSLITHIKTEAALGTKFSFGAIPEQKPGNYQLFYNEVEIGDNTILFWMDGNLVTFKTFNMLNVLNTSDKQFCEDTERHIYRIMEKSTQISNSSEKDRAKFFNLMEGKIRLLQEKIKN